MDILKIDVWCRRAQPVVLATALLAGLPAGSTAQDAGEVVLFIAVTGIERDEGSVRIALFDGPEGFTDEPMTAVVVRPEELAVEWSVRVPRGRYAVAVVHDADDDGRLNTNLLGMPQERYGFSNDARGRFGPPSFEDASFLAEPPEAVVSVNVR